VVLPARREQRSDCKTNHNPSRSAEHAGDISILAPLDRSAG